MGDVPSPILVNCPHEGRRLLPQMLQICRYLQRRMKHQSPCISGTSPAGEGWPLGLVEKGSKSAAEEVETGVGQLPPMGIQIEPSENMLLLSVAHSGNVCITESTLHSPQRPHCRVQGPLQTSTGCGCSRLDAYTSCHRLPRLPLQNCDLYERSASGRQETQVLSLGTSSLAPLLAG